MFLAPYCEQRGDLVVVDAEQGSRFAKEVAGDFNPIHDPDSRRFCVPGDLLFALVLHRYGIFESMDFRFAGMVGGGVGLVFPKDPGDTFDVTNEAGKPLLEVRTGGRNRRDGDFCDNLMREYVAFSGRNFPHILVPLLADQGVMINPERPLVIYESMGVGFDSLDFENPELRLTDSRLTVNGKRGNVHLAFDIVADTVTVGTGVKKLALGGLLPYDADAMAAVTAAYEARKAGWKSG